MTAYYNENDSFAAAWLMQLIAAGHIAPGVVDTRSIEDVTPDDLDGFTQCHFFAGIGVWSLAARQAGWRDDEPLWTGSCPCQPFSAAGKGGGFADERHLWPAWHWLIAECRPVRIAGEQVASRHVDPWLDLVQADLEGMGYAFGCVPSPSAGYGAPHIRDRAFWVADRNNKGLEGRDVLFERADERASGANSLADGLADASSERRIGRRAGKACNEPGSIERPERLRDALSRIDRPGPTNGLWRDADWIRCQDEPVPKWRPIEPGTFPLADAGAFRNRVGLLRGAGNAINLAQATEWLRVIR